MGSLCAESGATGVVVLEDRQEAWLVSNDGDVLVVNVLEAPDEGSWSSQRRDERGLIMRNKE